jgi:hypothetical protein
MSHIDIFSLREWLVPPILRPIFLVLLVAAAMFIQWSSTSADSRDLQTNGSRAPMKRTQSSWLASGEFQK